MTWDDITLEDNRYGDVGGWNKLYTTDGFFGIYVQPGKSKDKKYSTYPYWQLCVGVPQKSVKYYGGRPYVVVTPTFSQLAMFLKDILVHEYRIYLSRNRNSDFKVKQPWLKNLIMDTLIGEVKAQMEIDAYNVPEIYKICGIMKGEME